MTWPTITVEAAFGANPYAALSSMTWTDISTRVRAAKWSTPMRNTLRDGFTPGQIQALVLDNYNRDFDPTNLSGPYVAGGRSQIIPNLPIRIKATVGATTYPQIVAYRNTGAPVWSDPASSLTTWSATDAFKLLDRYPRTAVAAIGDNELSGARATRVLDSAGWASADRAIGTGLSRMQATILAGSPAKELVLLAASEGGEAWMSGDGKVTFRARDARLAGTTWTFTDAAAATMDYVDVALLEDDTNLTNWAGITRVGSTVQVVAQDSASRTRYGPFAGAEWDRADLIMSTDVEATSVAQMIVDLYSDSIVRFETMTLDPTTNDNLWPYCLGAPIGDQVSITRNPPGGGSAITRGQFLEGKEHTVVALDGGAQGQWTTVSHLSDAQALWGVTYGAWDSAIWDSSKWFY